MATVPLVPAQLNSVLQAITLQMDLALSFGPQNTPFYGVRIGWEQLGQPSQQINENVVFLHSVEVDDQYNRVRDVTYETNDTDTVKKITQYTRVWEVYWCAYGPAAFDNGRLLRTRLFDQDIHDQFAVANLYLVTDPRAPVYGAELKDGQWWDRVDFTARFNEFVTEELVEQSVASCEIDVYDQFGDFLFGETPPGLIMTSNFKEYALTGLINGTNVNFTSPVQLAADGSNFMLFLNGQKLVPGVGFVIIPPNTIVFATPPQPGDTLELIS